MDVRAKYKWQNPQQNQSPTTAAAGIKQHLIYSKFMRFYSRKDRHPISAGMWIERQLFYSTFICLPQGHHGPIRPVVISEDKFELVMMIFEKVTHGRTKYLCHVCSSFYYVEAMKTLIISFIGSCDRNRFPFIQEYQDVLSAPIPAPMFATFSVSSFGSSAQVRASHIHIGKSTELNGVAIV